MPRGALRVFVRAEVRAEPRLFVGLASDPERMRALHPRLTDARWLDRPQTIGSRAVFTVELPPALELLQPLIGAPRGILTLIALEPGHHVEYRLDADRVAGRIQLMAGVGGPAPYVVVSGELWAISSLARAMTVPSARLVERAITRAVRRTLSRADETLRGDA